jgi:hypothetical protein
VAALEEDFDARRPDRDDAVADEMHGPRLKLV